MSISIAKHSKAHPTSGIKHPKDFGFLPTAGADQNVKALQTALNGGGLIVIDVPGVYELNDTVLFDSNTRLVCAPGVVFKKVAPYCNVLLNRGALTKTYNENIIIDGLEICVNGQEAGPTLVYGLRAQVGFFYVKGLTITNFTCLDGGPYQFLMYIVTWERLHIENVRLAGDKDGIKLNNGHDAIISNLDLTTYDDGMSLCGTDYPSVLVEVGDVYNVRYTNVTDHQYKDIFGRTCLIYAGSWTDYAQGNEYHSGDSCLNGGKLYQCINKTGFVGASSVPPVHSDGIVTGTDTISWRYVQDCDFYHTNIYNITFDNCIFEKSGNLVAVWREINEYHRSHYPGTEARPSAWGISITNCKMRSAATQVLVCVTANLRDVSISNCVLDDMEAVLRVDTTAFGRQINASITGCTFRNTRHPVVALHDGNKVVDWGLPFTIPRERGYIGDAESDVQDHGIAASADDPLTVNCHLAGNNYSNSWFGCTVTKGGKLRVINLDLPFKSLAKLTPAVGDLCRHVDGLFLYQPTGWTHLSGGSDHRTQ